MAPLPTSVIVYVCLYRFSKYFLGSISFTPSGITIRAEFAGEEMKVELRSCEIY